MLRVFVSQPGSEVDGRHGSRGARARVGGHWKLYAPRPFCDTAFPKRL